jgi:hypothetical protein
LTSSDTKTSVYKHYLTCSSQREAILQALWSAIKHSSPEVVVMAKPSWKSTLKKASNDFNLQKLAKLIQEQEERIQWLPVKNKTLQGNLHILQAAKFHSWLPKYHFKVQEQHLITDKNMIWCKSFQSYIQKIRKPKYHEKDSITWEKLGIMGEHRGSSIWNADYQLNPLKIFIFKSTFEKLPIHHQLTENMKKENVNCGFCNALFVDYYHPFFCDKSPVPVKTINEGLPRFIQIVGMAKKNSDKEKDEEAVENAKAALLCWKMFCKYSFVNNISNNPHLNEEEIN